MKYSLHTMLATVILSIATLSINAQPHPVLATFEDITLQGADTTYLDTQIPNGDGIYPFTSDAITFYGNVSYGYWGGFNCSNHTDSVTIGYTNSASAITGSGYDGSSNFGVAFVSSDFSQPTYPTIPIGVKIDDAGYYPTDIWVTNTTYAYHYMADSDYYANNHFWYKLIIRGYLAGVQNADSVVFTLADFSDTNAILVNTWQQINLSGIGYADSLTFDVISNDTAGGYGINTPTFFAIDNLNGTAGGESGVANIHGMNVSINPNPAYSFLNINTKNPVDIKVFDMSGKYILNAKSTKSIDISHLASGTYWLQAYDDKNKQTGTAKFVKE